MSEIIGIDLGTTNSVLSFFSDGTPATVLIDNQKLLPSVVHLSNSEFTVGKIAKNLLVLEPESTVGSIKRKMGQDLTVPIGDRQMRPEELSALILKKIKHTAAEHLKMNSDDPIRAVVTVPAYFSEEQRQATRRAAELAGLQLERIINEPTAAALAFGMSTLDEAVYAVYDLGGGTFDISVIESDKGMVEVLATTGNNQLGGDDFDRVLADFIWTDFVRKNKLKNITRDKRTDAKLIRLAELAKISLSEQKETTVTESFFMTHNDINHHIDLTVSRNDFENLIKVKITETVDLLKKAVKEADLSFDEVDGILLVGGSSRIPLITEIIQEQTGLLPQLMAKPDEAVAHGAAVQGAIIDKKELKTVLVDITPYSLGIGVMDDIAHFDLMRAMKNYEKLPEDFEHNLGVSRLIRKNTPLPARNAEKFSSIVPFQEAFQIQVFQGEETRFAKNKIIGECKLTLEDPPEDPSIEVTFHLDINGILNFEAVELNTNKKITATFKSSRGQRIREELLEKEDLKVSTDGEDLLQKRAQKLLDGEDLNEEDRADLEETLENYKNELEDGSSDNLEEIRTELVDALYYLENN